MFSYCSLWRHVLVVSCHEDRLRHSGKGTSMSIVAAGLAARGRVLGGLWSCPGWVCGHLLGLRSLSRSWSVVTSSGFCGHVMGLWSSLGSVVVSWIVGCGHVLDAFVVISWVCGPLLSLCSFPGSWFVVMPWVCGNFLARGLWSCPGWVCDHLLGL